MNSEKDKRKLERLKKWSYCLIRNSEVIASNKSLDNSETDIERCLSLLHELRRMAWPELNDDLRINKTIVKMIRPSVPNKN
ncbi:MAG: hypothetical protein JXK07_16665 [Spirochaetes bacterium]|nr:hypothetical protein [Spirochaetota bacterium]MBN2771218.1 hypothetical protein [Spirochaetota bacterium]